MPKLSSGFSNKGRNNNEAVEKPPLAKGSESVIFKTKWKSGQRKEKKLVVDLRLAKMSNLANEVANNLLGLGAISTDSLAS